MMSVVVLKLPRRLLIAERVYRAKWGRPTKERRVGRKGGGNMQLGCGIMGKIGVIGYKGSVVRREDRGGEVVCMVGHDKASRIGGRVGDVDGVGRWK